MEARPSKRRKKMMMKKTTKSLIVELEDLPVEVLVKIFNYLSNRDIRCGVSLVCKRFLEICQDESLIPVKDICLHGLWDDKKKRQVAAIIRNSQKLTSLKIKTLIGDQAVNDLVRIAFEACPQLTHLEIEIGETDLEYNGLMEIIKEHGKDICSINLLIGNYASYFVRIFIVRE